MDQTQSMNEQKLSQLLGIETSKIGYYAEVKQKIQELETANLGLRSTQAELQAVFDAISDGVVIYNCQGRVQYRNHVTPRMFPAETRLESRCHELFHNDSFRDPEQCPVEKALAGQDSQYAFSVMSPRGQNRFFETTTTTIEDPSGSRRALVFIRDVTEKRNRELQLLQAEKMSSIGLLAAGVAHEINNPMTSVAVYAEALQRRFRESPELAANEKLVDFPKYLDVIVREVYRCKGIIDSLLSFSRRSDGSFGTLNINQIIGEVQELVLHKSSHDSICIEQSLAPDLPYVQGDASALRQVFLNLVLNAFQAISGSGIIRLSTSYNEQTNQIQASVCDSGCGISDQILDQIWTPFFTTKAVGKGQGLGLAVTYDIVKKHGGDIVVKSAVNEGSTFDVLLPALQE